MKKTFTIILIIFCISLNAHADENTLIEQYKEMELDEIFVDVENSFPEFDGEEIIQNLSNGVGFKNETFFDTFIEKILKNIKEISKTFVMLVVVGYIVSLLNTTGTSFAGGSSDAAFTIGYCIYAGLAVAAFLEIISPVKETIQLLVAMIKTMIPTLLTMLSLSGGINTSALMSTVLISMVSFISIVLGEFLVNITVSSVALSISDKMSNKINISSSIKFLNKFVKWVILFCMAIYSGIYGVYGLSGTALDKRIGKATKFAVGSGIPVVGGVVSDSLEIILSTVSTLKSLTGVVGIIAICALVLLPLVRVAIVMWMFRLCAVVLEPVSDVRIVNLTTDIAENVSTIFAILASISLLFIGCIGVILISGNVIM